MTTAAKTYVTKSVTVGMDDNTLKSITDAAKKVGAPNDATVGVGGPVANNAENTETSLFSVTFSFSEEI